MLELNIKHSDGERELCLSAKNMNELTEKIKDWQSWDDFVSMFKQTKRYKRDPEGEIKRERESGWYFFDNIRDI